MQKKLLFDGVLKVIDLILTSRVISVAINASCIDKIPLVLIMMFRLMLMMRRSRQIYDNDDDGDDDDDDANYDVDVMTWSRQALCPRR